MSFISSIQSSVRGVSDNFFSSVFTSLGEGINKIGSEVLPNWVNRELEIQTEDLLRDDTWNQERAEQRVDDPEPGIQRIIFTAGGFKVTGQTLLIVVGVALTGVLVYKLM